MKAVTVQKPIFISPKEGCRILDIGMTSFYKILPQLDSGLVGKSRKVTLESVERYAQNCLSPQKRRAGPGRPRKAAGR